MSDWVHSNVGAVTLYQRAGGTPTATTDAYYGGEIPFVTIEDITNGTRYLDKTVKNLSELGLRTSAAWLVKEPHVLYSMYATVGKPIVNRIACATNQAIIALKASEAVEQDFLFYQLLFIRPQVYKFTSQTTQSNLNASSVRKLPIAYPKSRATQRKIASILSTIDTAIEQTEALIEKCQHIKAGLMHDLFTRGVLPNGQLRPPREQAPELYQETAMGWIPREWQIAQAGQLCSLITKGTTPASTDMWESSEGIRFLRVDNLTFDGRFDFTTSSYRISELTHTTTLSRSKCVPGDVLMNIVGPPLGKVSLVTPEIGEINTNQAIAIFRPTSSLSSAFLLRWLLSSGAKRWFHQRAKQTSGQLNLTLAMCQELEIPLPSIEEQGVMEMRLQAAEELVQSEMDRMMKLQAQKLGLMQDLLTGKVPVTVDTPPSEAVA